MESKQYTQCGGCGAETPIDRCIGCFHPFEPFFRNEYIEWINLADNYTEDWQIMHCRYASDGRKLDTDLFEEKDNGLVKIGGTGRLEYKEVEYMVGLSAPQAQSGPRWVKASERLPEKGGKENSVIVRGVFKEPGYNEWPFVAYGFRNFHPEKQEMYFELGSKSYLTNDVEWLDEQHAAGREEDAVAFAEWLNSNFVSIENKEGEAVYVEYSPQEYDKKQQFKIGALYKLFKQQKEK